MSEYCRRIKDVFIQGTFAVFETSNKYLLYKHLINNFDIQIYLKKSIPISLQRLLTKFRLSYHDLFVETGRHKNIPRYNRICSLCNKQDIEDEYHFILICPVYDEIRHKFLKPYFYKKPSMYKLINLLTSKKFKELCNIAKFLKSASILRKSLL